MDTSDKGFLNRLTQIVDARLQESNLSSETLADDFYISTRHFNRKVNAATGMNTTLYIRARRVAMACELLRDTDLPISEIFVKCGMESANYFSRLFKKEMGISPTEYRKKYQ